MSPLDHVRQAAKKAGLPVKELANGGHVQIMGAVTVNYYPFSRRRTAYIGNTRKGIPNVSPKEAVALAGKQPPVAQRRQKRKRKFARNAILKKELYLKQDALCHWCREHMYYQAHNKDGLSATIEHVIPLARNGLDEPSNIVLAHESCNQKRGMDMPEISNDQTS